MLQQLLVQRLWTVYTVHSIPLQRRVLPVLLQGHLLLLLHLCLRMCQCQCLRLRLRLRLRLHPLRGQTVPAVIGQNARPASVTAQDVLRPFRVLAP